MYLATCHGQCHVAHQEFDMRKKNVFFKKLKKN